MQGSFYHQRSQPSSMKESTSGRGYFRGIFVEDICCLLVKNAEFFLTDLLLPYDASAVEHAAS